MSDFKSNDFNIQEEDDLARSVRVVKISQPLERKVQPFQFNDIKPGSAGTQFRREGASSDRDEKRDHRFVMSQLARDALSVGKEEDRVIEAQVAEKVAALTSKAREDGFRQGYDDGTQRGHDEAHQKLQSECTRRLEQFDALLSSMEEAKTTLLEANRDFLMNVAFRIAKTVLLRELATDKEYLLRLARELIEKTSLRENLTVKIHPSDAESMELLREGLLKGISGLKNLSIELSDHVALGGCIVETEWGAIDASLETQLSRIQKAIEDPSA